MFVTIDKELPLKEYQNRLIEEFYELQERITKLGVFLKTIAFFELDHKQRQLLQRQHNVMTTYEEILNERIKLF